jgi:hypothetical protein
MSNFEVLGIALKNRDVVEKGPKPELTTTTAELAGQTNGKLFVAIKDNDPKIPNALKLIVDDKEVAVRKNEKWMQTNSEQPNESGIISLAFDFPMRFIDGVVKPARYSIIFVKGTISGEKFLEDGESDEYFLNITQDELPTPVYNQAVDGE